MDLTPINKHIAKITKSKCIQLYMMNNYNDFVRSYLAENPNISANIQSVLVKDNYIVKCGLTRNPNIMENIQLCLAKDDNGNIQFYLARNTSISEKAQLILAKNSSNAVKRNLLENKNICNEARELAPAMNLWY